MFEQTVQRFLASCESDAAMQEFARKRAMSLRFRIADENLEFTLIFKDGIVRAAIGSLTDHPDLDVKTDAETFDGVMSGRVNGATAYMMGKLKFRGDTMKGMAMQKVAKEMIRLWQGAQG